MGKQMNNSLTNGETDDQLTNQWGNRLKTHELMGNQVNNGKTGKQLTNQWENRLTIHELMGKHVNTTEEILPCVGQDQFGIHSF